MTDSDWALSEKEKQTLRLIVRGHDAKSAARHLGLSVHTINERLRDARRKMAVSSSREAARLLFERESPIPETLGDEQIGEAAGHADVTADAMPTDRDWVRPALIAAGATIMSLILAALALTTIPASVPTLPSAPAMLAETPQAEVEAAARRWLALVDESRWEESWRATGDQFRALNTVQVWTSVSQRVRVPLGAMRSRTLISAEDVPAPPNGYMMVKFRTSFANKADAIETVSLTREGGGWRVVGVYVD